MILKFLKWKPWMRVPALIIGVLCLFAAIWFGFALIPLAVFQSVWLRAVVIGVLLALILGSQVIAWRRRRKLAAEIEDELVRVPEGDGKVLAERMNTALARLKKTGGATYLYDLPWYVIIGPPGAGKTTALRNSGIEFPVSGDDGGLEGFGGTRYCDWWFSEDAVLIDTAGRYTTQDSDAVADGASWTSFLDLLKRSRPDQPINGVMLAFSAEDMMTASDEVLTAHANTVRDRLAELHEALRVDFPVYVLFTKADLISGFREYFSSFSMHRRKSVWGVTFQTKDRKAPTHEQVGPEFDLLVSRLSDELIDRLSEEPDGISRVAIFGLPGQMALMRDNVSTFLRRVFAPSKHKTNAILRGFYFTSGTQEGTPIDQVLGAMAQTETAPGAFGASFMSGQGKSYFIHDLLKRVIFQERDWVSFDARAVRRAAILRSTGLAALAVVTLGLLGLFGYSAWQNYRLVQVAGIEAGRYARTAEEEIARTEISDPSLLPVLPFLDQLQAMPAGYGAVAEASFWEGLGLGQRKRLGVAADSAYADALEQMLRPRLILDLETRLPQIRANEAPAQIYRALKVYMLLGGQAPAPDDAAIMAWFDDQWRSMFSGAADLTTRTALQGHLQAMLKLDDTRDIRVTIDQATIDAARAAIVQMSLADQAYALISERARTAGMVDFDLIVETGDAARQVFITTDGADLETVGVPGLYTYEGYWSFFFDQLLDVREVLERDKWVLGEQADLVNFDNQMRGLDQALQARYAQDFRAAWNAMFDNIKLANMAADKPTYDILAAAAAEFSSPILKLVEAVDRETKLTRELERVQAALAEAETQAGGAGGIIGELRDVFVDSTRRRSDRTGKVLMDAAMNTKNQARVGGTADGPLQPVERIESQFRDWHDMLLGPDQQRPIDVVLQNLRDIRENLRLAEAVPGQSAAMLPQLLSDLTRNNSRLPEKLREFVNDADRDFRQEASDATLADMNRALNDEVAFICRDQIVPFFPFAADSTRQLPSATFGRFFGRGGVMDKYFSDYLARHVIRGGSGLEVNPDSPLAGRISPATLRQFERAEAIRTAFFGGDGTVPLVNITVQQVASHPTVEFGQLMINGVERLSRLGDPAIAIEWPGVGSGAMIALAPVRDRDVPIGRRAGPWDVVSLFDAASSISGEGSQQRMTFNIGGRSITYDFGFSATVNPFLMPELRDFGCPQSIDF